MAVKTYTIANFSQSSTWTVIYDPVLGKNRLSGDISISTLNKSVTFSGIPAGSAINSAVLTATVGGTAYKIRQLDGAGFSGARAIAASRIVPGAAESFEFKFQGSGSTSTGGTITSSLAYSNIKIVVDYTVPTESPVDLVRITGSDVDVYSDAGSPYTLGWRVSAGTGNTVENIIVQHSLNGGSWSTLATLGAQIRSLAITSSSTPGARMRYRVMSKGNYVDSAYANSPNLYTRSAVSAPTSLILSKTSAFTGESLTLTFSGASEGIGTTVTGYEVYQGATKIGSPTASPYTFVQPGTPGVYKYKVKALGSVAGYDSEYSSEVALTTNPRQSEFTLNKTEINLGMNITATIVPVNPSYSHTITWTGASGYTSGEITLTQSVTTSTYAPPVGWSEIVPNATTFTATCTVKTYNDAVQVGDAISKTFTCVVPESVVPTVTANSLTVANIQPLVPGHNSVFLVNFSKAQVSASAQEAYNSPIVEYSFSGGGQSKKSQSSSWITDVLTVTGDNTFSVTVTDSRGRVSQQQTKIINVNVYERPVTTINTAYRASSAGVKQMNGTYFNVKATAVAKKTGQLIANAIKQDTMIQQYREKGTEPWLPANGYPIPTNGQEKTALGGGAIAIDKSYEVRVLVADTVYPNTLVPSQIWTINPMTLAFYFKNNMAQFGRTVGPEKTLVTPDDWTIQTGAYKSMVATNSGPGGAATPPLIVQSTNKVSNLNADRLDDYHAGNATGQIPVSNGTVNTNLNAQMLGGKTLAGVLADALAAYKANEHRVGTLYFTLLNNEADRPATLFGGGWTLLTAGTFPVAAGTGYAAGTTGGSATHTLTVEEMPPHRHGTLARSGAGSLGAWARIAYPNNTGTETTMYTDYQGSGDAHNNMPPWKAYYIWERTS